MPVSGIKVVDANVWLALAFEGHSRHPRALSWFVAQPPDTCAFTRMTQLALLRHLTNSTIMGQEVPSQKDAWSNFDALSADPKVIFLEEPFGTDVEFRNLTQAKSPSHKQWSDAYLVALAKSALAQVTTFDRGFKRFSGLAVELLE